MSFAFLSTKNHLRRHSSTGSARVSAPSTSTSWFTYKTDYVVTHNLGYIPQVRVYFDSADDGKLYPAGGNRNGGTYLGLAVNSVFCTYTLTTTTMTITLESNNSTSGSRDVHWVVYEDEAV